jgi:hypothetical protein
VTGEELKPLLPRKLIGIRGISWHWRDHTPETGDARQQGDATATVLLGQKADEEPAITLVDSGDDAVEGAMFGGGAAPGVLAAGGTLADVDRQGLMARTHRPYLPLEGRRSGKVIITTNRASYFCTAP